MKAGAELAVMLGVLLWLLGGVVVQSGGEGGGGRIISADGTDLVTQFVPWRAFGFGEMAGGNIPLWNPHSYSGNVFVGNWQSALFYPPNWVHMVLPMGWAVNGLIVVHLLIAAWLVRCWARCWGMSRAAACGAGLVWVMSGSYWLHLYPGHVPFLCTACWTPGVLWCVDELLKRGKRSGEVSGGMTRGGWGLLAGVFVAMQCLAGYPQPVYMTAMAAVAYGVARALSGVSWSGGDLRRDGVWRGLVLKAIGWMSGGYALAVLLSAVQVWTGIEAAGESVRAGGTSYGYASSFAMPVENVLLLLCPTLMGDLSGPVADGGAYVGRWLMWEVHPYVGVGGLVLGVMGVMCSRGKQGGEINGGANSGVVLILLGGCLLSVWVALGAAGGLHGLLFTVLPGFDSFRVPGRFLYIASLFWVMLVGAGFDALLRRGCSGDEKPGWRGMVVFGCGVMGVGVAMGVIGLLMRGGEWGEMWGGLLAWVKESGAGFLPAGAYGHGPFIEATGKWAGGEVLAYAAIAVVLGAMVVVIAGMGRLSGTGKLRSILCYGVGLLAVGEVIWTAGRFVASSPLERGYPKEYAEGVKGLNAGERVLHAGGGGGAAGGKWVNEAMLTGALDIWGYDQVVLKRYAEFMNRTQQRDPWHRSADVKMEIAHPRWAMLRCVITLETAQERGADGKVSTSFVVRRLRGFDGKDAVTQPRVTVVGKAEVWRDSIDRLSRLMDTSFDPLTTVVLEEIPLPMPSAAAAANNDTGAMARVLAEGTDWLEIEAYVPEPGVLVVSDSYARGWVARPMEGGAAADGQQARSVQETYKVMPANHMMRGVPLMAGRHLIRMSYEPGGYEAGWWGTILGLVVMAGWGGVVAFKKRETIVR